MTKRFPMRNLLSLVVKSFVLSADLCLHHVVVPSSTPKLESRLDVVLFFFTKDLIEGTNDSKNQSSKASLSFFLYREKMKGERVNLPDGS